MREFVKLPRTVNFVFAILLGVLSACDQSGSTKQSQSNDANQSIVSPVLATVNSREIRQSDVEFMIQRTFADSDRFAQDPSLQKKVLDSLIASSAMQQSMEKSLDEEKVREISKRVKAYEEELYVKEYLQAHAIPDPVSTQQLNDYYASHEDEFGGGEKRSFELLKIEGATTEAQRSQFLQLVPQLKKASNWSAVVDGSEVKLVHQRAIMQPGLLDSALETELQRISAGETSDVVMIKQVPHLLRVVSIEKLSAKPLHTISAQIRKKLAAVQLKKAVKIASEQAIKQFDVDYKDVPEQ